MSLWAPEKLGEKAKEDAENDKSATSLGPGRYSVGTGAREGTIELSIFITATKTGTRPPQLAASFIS